MVLDPGLTPSRLSVLVLDLVPILLFLLLLAAFLKIRSIQGPDKTLFGLSFGKVAQMLGACGAYAVLDPIPWLITPSAQNA